MSNKDYDYHSNISRVKRVQFSLLSPDEIKNNATCKVIDHTLYITSQDGISTPSPGGLYDAKMGVIDSNVMCATCEQKSTLCPGHFGYIELAAPIFHMHYINRIQKLLKCICFRCSKLLLDDIEINKLNGTDMYATFDLIYEKSKKIKTCRNENGCGAIQPTRYTKEGMGKIFAEWLYKDRETKKVLARASYILKLFKRITDDDCKKLGFSPQFCRPEWLICTVLPVPPPSVRPSVKQDNNQRSDDDLTYKLIDIVKANAKLEEKIKQNDDYIDDHITMLQYHVATLINNDQPFGAGMPKATAARSGRELKSLQQRVKSKDGRIRGNLMGKRVDFSARSVITPDPNLKIDELGVPIKIAKNLTFPEKVTKYNYDRLKTSILNGYNNYPGVKSIKKLDGSIKNMKHVDLEKMIDELQYGDIVNRHLIDNDIVLFNRQPSLHKMSMMAHSIKVMIGDTFRLNVCVTTPYNADFDGDEMNMHVPQSQQTKSELYNLAMVPTQIISPQSNKPVIGLVQDALLGASRMTLKNENLRDKVFIDIEQNDEFLFSKKDLMALMMWNEAFTGMSSIGKPIVYNNNEYWTGRQIFSTILPKINIKNKDINIKNGILNGYLKKKNLATSGGSLVHVIFNDLDKDHAAEYLNNAQGITNNFLLQSGFSVGVSDLIINKNIVKKIKDIIQQKKDNVTHILQDIQKGLLERKYNTSLNDEFETLVTNELNTAADEIGKLTTNNLNVVDNRFVNMGGEEAGSKGNAINLCQMIACIGQSSVDGKRIPKHYKNRTLPHFSQFDNNSESRGFIENSFYKGLKPHEFYFHAMGGREGIIDTAVKTSETGYIQRRLIKALEDVKVCYDLTLRNHNDEIIQFLYGEDGYDSAKLEIQNIDDLIDISILEFEQKYNNLDKVKHYILPNIVKNMTEDVNNLNNILYDQILNMRIYIVRNIINNSNIEIYQPLNIDRIILNNVNNFESVELSNIEPEYLFTKLDELIEKIKIKRNDIDNKEYNPSYLLHNLIRFKLSPYNVYIKHKLNKLAFDNIIEEILYKFKNGFAEPGEMIGTITAQCIGEPATQMTLNTFHYAGVAAKSNVTRGVPRLKELLSVSKNIKNPSLSIYLNNIEETDLPKIKQIKNSINTTYIKDVVIRTSIYFDPDITDTSSIIHDNEINEIVINNKLWNEFMDKNDYNCEEGCNENNICPYILVIEVSKKKLLDRNVDMNLIGNTINNLYNISKTDSTVECLLSNDNIANDRLLLRIRLNEGDENEDDFNLLKAMEKSILNEKLNGINNITDANIRKKTYKYVTDEGDIYDKKEVILDSAGTNLLNVLGLDDVNKINTISNDIHEVLNVLGIEAARNILIEEFMDVINSAGASLNHRHIEVLVDTMTFNGNIMSIDRFGINRGNYGPLAKASFEEMTDQLYKSAIFGEIDECNGVSANVIFGQESNCGTGISDILFDEAKFFSDNNIKVDDYELTEELCGSVLTDFIYDNEEVDDDDTIFDLPEIDINII